MSKPLPSGRPPSGRPLWLLVALVLAGCAAPTHTLAPSAEPDRLAEANRAFAERSVTVVLRDGSTRRADGLRLAPDSTTWVNPATGALVTIATSDVSAVERRSSGARTVGEGALAGLAAGAFGGALYGASEGFCELGSCGRPPSAGERGFGAFLFGTGGAFVGALGGTFLGAITVGLSDRTERFVLAPADAGEAGANQGPAPASGAPPPNP